MSMVVNLRIWAYLRNLLLFFVVVPPAMVLTAAALQLVGQYTPPSGLLISETKQAYFLSVFIGPAFSLIHTYILRHAHFDSRRPGTLRSAWYATLLGLLGTLSLLHVLPLVYDAIFYLIPGAFFYGIIVGKLNVNTYEEPPQVWGLRKVALGHYLLNACLFVIIAVVVITLGLWIGLKSGIIEGLFVAAPIFLFILVVLLSIIHTFLLHEVSGTSTDVFQRRSVGLAGGLALLVGFIYFVYGQPEFFLFFAAALIYGWVVSRLVGKTVSGLEK